MDESLKIRKHLTPPRGLRAAAGVPDMRREVRREVSERVTLREPPRGTVCEGWTLNVSRGGVRVIVERQVDLGQVFEITVGRADASPLVRHGRVVWFQQEADGYIVGIAFGSYSGELAAQ
jgi:hypothetical protein